MKYFHIFASKVMRLGKMDFSRYEKLRTLVRANFSEQTRALVDEALVYADGKLAACAL